MPQHWELMEVRFAVQNFFPKFNTFYIHSAATKFEMKMLFELFIFQSNFAKPYGFYWSNSIKLNLAHFYNWVSQIQNSSKEAPAAFVASTFQKFPTSVFPPFPPSKSRMLISDRNKVRLPEGGEKKLCKRDWWSPGTVDIVKSSSSER